MMPRSDHMVIHPAPTPRFECEHCGATRPVTLPIDVEAFAAIGRQFAEEHRECKKVEVAR